MPRTGSGQFVLAPKNPVQANTIIETAWANPTLADIANGLSTSIATDGQTTPTANLPMGKNNHTNVGPALAPNQYARADQVQGFMFNIVGSVSNDAGRVNFSGTLSFGIGVGTVVIPNFMPVIFVPSANNGGPTNLIINQGTPHPILNQDLTPLSANQIFSGRPYALVYNGANWILVTNTLDVAQLNTLYVPKTGTTMSGPLILSESPLTGGGSPALQAATKAYVDGQISGSVAGVASFNTRTGAVALLSSDITGALAYIPFNAAGGIISGTVVGQQAQFTRIGANLINLAVQTMGSTGAVTVDAANFQNFWTSMTGNIVLTAAVASPIANMVGQIIRLQFVNTTGKTITWPTGTIWPMPTPTPPVIDAGATKQCLATLCYTGSGWLANASVY